MVFQSARIKSNVSPTFEGLPILLRFFWPVPYVSLSWPAENIKPPKWSSQRDKPSRPSGATNSFALAKHLRRLGKTNSILGPIFCIPNNRPIVRNAFDWRPKIQNQRPRSPFKGHTSSITLNSKLPKPLG